MGYPTGQSSARAVWALARRQHRVVELGQLRALGYSRQAIKHRLRNGRLHRRYRGVYAVGSPDLTEHGELMAAVLACGDGAVISHDSAAALYEILPRPGEIHLSVPSSRHPRDRGVRVHRRAGLRPQDVTRHLAIPVTAPVATIVDLVATKPPAALEKLISDADIARLCTPEQIRSELDAMPPRRGTARLRRLLDRRTFRLTRSHLERLFLPIAAAAGLPRPLTRQPVNGFEVDFYWPELGLVVETDGLRYHRTAHQQTSDMLRDQRHTAAGLTCLRFSHWQVAHDPGYVRATLAAVAARVTRVASRA